MMLKKIQYIKKLGVFDDFSWDSEVKTKAAPFRTLLISTSSMGATIPVRPHCRVLLVL